MPRKVVYVKHSSQRVCQLTGEWDRTRGRGVPAYNRTESRFGLRGTDLGASFEHKGKCWFLFGDTHPSGPHNESRPPDGDAIAYTTDRRPDTGGVRLTFVTAPDGGYLSPRAEGVSAGTFEVPTGGFSHKGRMYVFFTTDSRVVPGKGAVMGRSVLLRSDDDARTWRAVYTVSTNKIIYISPAVTDGAALGDALPPGLRRIGPILFLWAGTTEYRRDNPYLAALPLARVEDRAALRYFAGLDRGARKPRWSEREGDAVPLFDQRCIGELCVTWNPFLKQWLMLYNCEDRPGPRGIHFRVADAPWGPWSDSVLLFEPWRDKGYGSFLHISRKFSPGAPDALHDPGREDDWGGEYGPYVVERFTTGDRERRHTTIYWVMSTWNPYNTVLMRSTLEARDG
jgi:hypothetical protein